MFRREDIPGILAMGKKVIEVKAEEAGSAGK